MGRWYVYIDKITLFLYITRLGVKFLSLSITTLLTKGNRFLEPNADQDKTEVMGWFYSKVQNSVKGVGGLTSRFF